MRIVIAGAGDVGFHLAELLAFENQDIILIDENQEVLDYAATHLDVMTLHGDSASIEVLKRANVNSASLFLAVTTSQKNNLMTAILAKQMGAKQTIARVKSREYLDKEQLELFKKLGVDNLISPRSLAAKELTRLVSQCSFTDIFEFEDGKINLVGLTLDDYSPLVNCSLNEIQSDSLQNTILPIAILRGHRTIIPRGDTVLYRNDHIYFISKASCIQDVEDFVGRKHVEVKNVMIVGGSGLAYEAALSLQKNYNVKLVEKDKNKCKLLAEHLDNTLIIHGNASNIDLLESEGLSRMDVFIALTGNNETNIIACLTAKNRGVYKTIAQVENKEYTHISQNIGVDTLINKKLIAANNIFRFVRKGHIEAITGLHGVDAEVIEYSIDKENQLTKKSLKDLHFPDTAIIGGVIRGEESLIPNGDFQLQKGDKVIIFALPESISRLEKLFR
ncbi:MAG: trk system potassium uptake protein TrkA [Saprospiraceae bacterium]|jgi:trk system potassium uptake protein TrkA